MPPTAAASIEAKGTVTFGANLPARLAASPAPRMMPKFITEVTSASTLEDSAFCGRGQVQNAQLSTGTPTSCAVLAPHRPKPKVTDHGCPARSSVATLRTAIMRPAPTSGHGPEMSQVQPG